MELPSLYTPEGTYAFLLFVLALTLVAAVAYLILFTGAYLPP